LRNSLPLYLQVSASLTFAFNAEPALDFTEQLHELTVGGWKTPPPPLTQSAVRVPVWILPISPQHLRAFRYIKAGISKQEGGFCFFLLFHIR
jgi:hypothetical protein